MSTTQREAVFGPEDRYLIETWGCQMNAHDSEKLAGSLERMGVSAARDRERGQYFHIEYL